MRLNLNYHYYLDNGLCQWIVRVFTSNSPFSSVSGHFIFKGTMPRIQYVDTLSIYLVCILTLRHAIITLAKG